MGCDGVEGAVNWYRHFDRLNERLIGSVISTGSMSGFPVVLAGFLFPLDAHDDGVDEIDHIH